MLIKQKIQQLPEAKKTISRWKEENESIIFTNGCFDLIHLGHIDYLCRASSLGNKFIIGLNSDESVTRLKGEKRPIKDLYSRAMILASFFFIDLVIPFEQDTPEILIETITPDMLVKGGDYKINEIVGAQHVMKNNGSVAIIPYLDGYSTSKIESKIKGR